jgi:alanyl-tRNA synthetase
LFSKIFKDLQNLMSGFYDELNIRADLISETLHDEEVRFRETLTKGLDILSQEIPNIKNNTLDGKVAFKLYDTFGFPLDLTQDFLKSKNIVIDIDSFNRAMEAQKEEARASWKGSGDTATQKIWFELAKKYNPTIFDGYEKNSVKSKIVSILHNSNEVDFLKDQSIEGCIIITENTCFYGESGGQVGDTGIIKAMNGQFLVIDTKKTPQGIFIHFGKLISGV